MTTEDERNLDMLVAELDRENRMMRARNERLEQELDNALSEVAHYKAVVARIIAVSELAFRDGRSKGVGEVGPSAIRRDQERND